MMKRDVIGQDQLVVPGQHSSTSPTTSPPKSSSHEALLAAVPAQELFLPELASRLTSIFSSASVRKAAGDPDFTLPYWAL